MGNCCAVESRRGSLRTYRVAPETNGVTPLRMMKYINPELQNVKGVSESKPNGHPHPVRYHLQDLQDGRYLQKGSGGGYGGHHDGYGGQNDEIRDQNDGYGDQNDGNRDHNDGYGGQLGGYGGQPGGYGDTLTVDDSGDNVSQSSWFRKGFPGLLNHSDSMRCQLGSRVVLESSNNEVDGSFQPCQQGCQEEDYETESCDGEGNQLRRRFPDTRTASVMSISSDSRRMKRRKEVGSPQDARHRRSGVVDCVMDNLDVVCVIRNGVDDAYVGVDDLEGEGDESFWIPGSLARHMGYPIHLNNSDQSLPEISVNGEVVLTKNSPSIQPNSTNSIKNFINVGSSTYNINILQGREGEEDRELEQEQRGIEEIYDEPRAIMGEISKRAEPEIPCHKPSTNITNIYPQRCQVSRHKSDQSHSKMFSWAEPEDNFQKTQSLVMMNKVVVTSKKSIESADTPCSLVDQPPINLNPPVSFIDKPPRRLVNYPIISQTDYSPMVMRGTRDAILIPVNNRGLSDDRSKSDGDLTVCLSVENEEQRSSLHMFVENVEDNNNES